VDVRLGCVRSVWVEVGEVKLGRLSQVSSGYVSCPGEYPEGMRDAPRCVGPGD
jgi:hypothetical protein